MCIIVSHYARDLQYRKKMIEGNVLTMNDQESTPSEEWDVETYFAITKLDEVLNESQENLKNCSRELDEKLKEC